MNEDKKIETENDLLSETQVLENLTDGNEETPVISETQVFEALTDAGKYRREEDLSETRAMETMTDPVPVLPAEDSGSEKETNSALKEIMLFLRDLGICMAAVLLLVNFVIRPVRVRGSSMYPTLKDGEIGLSNLLGYRMDGIRRFDIVIVYIESKDEYLVKRCVGLPGDTISYQDGTLFVNGMPVEEKFLETDYRAEFGDSFMNDIETFTLKEDEYWCLGDNRPKSSDSRFYGPFAKEQIISKGILVLFPFTEFGVKSW